MASTLDPSDTESMSLEEYCAFVERNVDPNDLASLEESAWALKRLANNRQFLIDSFHDEIHRLQVGGEIHMYTPQSMVLYRSANYIVRANIWIEPSSDPKRRALELPVFSYQSAHDHNFDFLTVGYFGPGYETEIFEYDRRTVEGLPGEPVELAFLERTMLPSGKLMMFRGGVDVHTQLPPKALSISLNLLVQSEEKLSMQQLFFDVANSRVSHYAEDRNSHRVALLSLASRLANDETIELLKHLAAKHGCGRTRAAAYSALMGARPAEREYFVAAAARDSDRWMAKRLELHFAQYG